MAVEYPFEALKNAPLVIDAVYKGGTNKNMSDEVLSKLLPKTGNAGGFRKTNVEGTQNLAYLTIYTTMSEPEWPDFLDIETGLFRYYGDNRLPGHDIYDTKKKGNITLRNLFEWLNNPEYLNKIPPILIFRRESRRDVRFLGLAVPGSKNLGPNQELIAFWRTMNGERFQNYEAYFTILDTGEEPISKDWLRARVSNSSNCDESAPCVWKNFISKGRDAIVPLSSPKNIYWPSKEEQLPDSEEGKEMLNLIRKRYHDFPQDFENCAVHVTMLMDPNFIRFDVTRPWRDGGRDAIGIYRLGTSNSGLTIDCALEAKLYGENNGVGVRNMSRLISRIRYRQFGIFITTSYIDKQAYMEVKEDGHPVLILTGKDIVEILRKRQIGLGNLNGWLDSIEGELRIG